MLKYTFVPLYNFIIYKELFTDFSIKIKILIINKFYFSEGIKSYLKNNYLITYFYRYNIPERRLEVDNFIEELAVKKVLSMDDILRLKNYIARKYKDNTSSERSDVLSQAVHEVLDGRLPGIGKEYRSTIKQDLLKNTILNDGKAILMSDIFNACVSIPEKPVDFWDVLTDWTNLYVESKVSDSDMKKYTEGSGSEIDSELMGFSKELIGPIETPLGISHEQAEVVSLTTGFKSFINLKKAGYLTCFLIFSLIAVLFQNRAHNIINTSQVISIHRILNEASIPSKSYINIFGNYLRNSPVSGLPGSFKYKGIDKSSLKKFLKNKKSLLAEEPYFSTIISVSKEYNLNPLVLFSIAGQEQGFVSKQIPCSKRIANNPFNVFHSWKEYNTNIDDACRIVCKTIIELCSNKPSSEDSFDWIGRKYAQDPKWSKYVKMIFNNMEQFNLNEEAAVKHL